MIVDFTVSNYRSIKEPVTLSFVAQKGRATKGDKNSTTPTDDSICAGYEVKGRDFKLLPVAAIFGANASGKSNVIRALDTLIECMNDQAELQPLSLPNFTPFKLDQRASKEPTSFALRFSDDGAIFKFELEFKEGIVVKEQLEYSPPPNQRHSTRLLYRRVFNFQSGEYEVASGDAFAGPHIQLLPTIRKQEVYFPLLARLDVPLIENFSMWSRLTTFGMFAENERIFFKYAARWFFKQPSYKFLALRVLQKFDTAIHDFEVIQREGQDNYAIYVLHQVNGDLIRWELEEESLGTQRLFMLLRFVLTAWHSGHAVIVDEFGANFHPKITREIIKLFHDPEINSKGAQLIFTSHDNTLWRGVLRRDEIWLTEKGADQATKLTPLSAYRPRNDLALDKAYLDGRFGGVPIIGDVEEAFEKASKEKELVDAA